MTVKSLALDMPEDKAAMLGFGTFENAVSALEGYLDRHTYVCGERFTMADVYVGSHIEWGLSFGTLPGRPSFKTYAERIAARDAHRRARATDQALIAEREAQS